MRHSILMACAAALALASLPGAASACRMPPPPTPAEREALIAQRQSAAWADAPLVYLAEVVEWGLSDGPEGARQVNLKLAPLVVLKGDGIPATLSMSFPSPERRCGRDFLDIQDGGAGAGQRFVVYAQTAAPVSAEDIWTQIYGEVRDPAAIQALAGRGWLQDRPHR